MRAATAVGNVAAVMDAETPHWWEKMRPDQLRMTSASECAMGQVYGIYGLEPTSVRRAKGFSLATCVHPRSGLSSGGVKRAWAREVARRQQAAAAERERRAALVARRRQERAAALVFRLERPAYADAPSEGELVGA